MKKVFGKKSPRAPKIYNFYFILESWNTSKPKLKNEEMGVFYKQIHGFYDLEFG